MTDLDRIRQGEDLPVDFASIEKSLSEMWRNENDGSADAVTRAALWNVIAHTNNDGDRNTATETLGRASATVPQRSIVIRSALDGPAELNSWISANCHIFSGKRQVCSEEISIVAGGHRVRDVPSLVNGLLIPELPVATWWIGDLPSQQEEYVQALLAPADRLIVDSVHFDAADDLRLLSGVAAGTQTIPADLNWIRMEEWRLATASVFDHPVMRGQLPHIRKVRVVYAGEGGLFGEQIEAFYYAAWLSGQSRHVMGEGEEDVQYRFDRAGGKQTGSLLQVEIELKGGGRIEIGMNDEGNAILATPSMIDLSQPTVTSYNQRPPSALIVRQLSARQEDPVFHRALAAASTIASSRSK